MVFCREYRRCHGVRHAAGGGNRYSECTALIQRAHDQLSQDLCINNNPALTSSLGGVSDVPCSPCLSDIPVIGNIPGTWFIWLLLAARECLPCWSGDSSDGASRGHSCFPPAESPFKSAASNRRRIAWQAAEPIMKWRTGGRQVAVLGAWPVSDWAEEVAD